MKPAVVVKRESLYGLSRDMVDACGLLRDGKSPFHGVYGASRQGRGGTMSALVARGLVVRCDVGLYWLTDAGRVLAGVMA